MLTNNYIPLSYYYANIIGHNLAIQYPRAQVMADTNQGTTCSCDGSCTGSCSGSCQGCSGSCTGTCSGTCTGKCTGTCSTTCTGNCAGTCTGGCESYCMVCQSYCQYSQTYSKNNGSNKPNGAGQTFTWSSTVDENKTILISATDWNKLAGYVENAAKVCNGGTSGSVTRVSSKDPITANIFNSMSQCLSSITNALVHDKTKTANKSIIYASDFLALQNGYNNAQLSSSAPNGEYPSPGKANSCCQKGQACMTKAQGRPSLQPCAGGQSPGSSL